MLCSGHEWCLGDAIISHVSAITDARYMSNASLSTGASSARSGDVVGGKCY